MYANCTSHSGRESTFAPQSRSSTARPGTGTRTATAGRCTPRIRFRWKSPAASAAPVEPGVTNAPARPSFTARAACTIEESGFARTACAGSSSLVTATGASTTFSKPSSSAAGPKTVTGTPARRPPSATFRGPRSAPFASSAITVAMLVVETGAAGGHDLAPAVVPARRADAVREHRGVALRARLQPRRRDLVLRAALVRARVGLLLLRDGHSGGESRSCSVAIGVAGGAQQQGGAQRVRERRRHGGADHADGRDQREVEREREGGRDERHARRGPHPPAARHV